MLVNFRKIEKRAEAVKNRAMPPIGGEERMAFIKQAEEDYQDYMILLNLNMKLRRLFNI